MFMEQSFDECAQKINNYYLTVSAILNCGKSCYDRPENIEGKFEHLIEQDTKHVTYEA